MEVKTIEIRLGKGTSSTHKFFLPLQVDDKADIFGIMDRHITAIIAELKGPPLDSLASGNT